MPATQTEHPRRCSHPTASRSGTTSPPSPTLQEKRDAYDALFRIAKFTTVFGYAGIDVHGDTAVVRTYHHKGATVSGGRQGRSST